MLRKGKFLRCQTYQLLTKELVNEILGDHNVDKQISDSRGDVSVLAHLRTQFTNSEPQIAYLMADISDVQLDQIKEIIGSLETLSCKCLALAV